MTLTERQQQVLDGLCAGKNDRQIAAEHGISDKTVQFHRTHLYALVIGGEKNQLKLVAVALRRKLVDRRFCFHCGRVVPANNPHFKNFCDYNCWKADWRQRRKQQDQSKRLDPRMAHA